MYVICPTCGFIGEYKKDFEKVEAVNCNACASLFFDKLQDITEQIRTSYYRCKMTNEFEKMEEKDGE